MKTIQDLLKRNGHALWSVEPDSSVDEAIKLMADLNVEALLVLEAGEPVGIVSEKDYFTKVVSTGSIAKETPVGKIMTQIVAYTSPEETIDKCLALMTEKQIRHLPVMADGLLVSIVSKDDLAMTIISDQQDQIYWLENYVLGAGIA
jgi:CBS domain-containing protein